MYSPESIVEFFKSKSYYEFVYENPNHVGSYTYVKTLNGEEFKIYIGQYFTEIFIPALNYWQSINACLEEHMDKLPDNVRIDFLYNLDMFVSDAEEDEFGV